jgi:hypothetical protein
MSLPSYSLHIHAGNHNRVDCPIRFTPPRTLLKRSWELADEQGNAVPLQILNGQEAAFIEPSLAAGDSRTYGLQPEERGNNSPSVSVRDDGVRCIEVRIHDRLFTRYNYADVPARPYFYPLLAPGEVSITRAYPMYEDVADETKDHPHHRSLWIAFGEVNQVDNWSEIPGHGHTVHQTTENVQSGAAAGGFQTTSLWTDARRQPILTQYLSVIVWATQETRRLLDIEVYLAATHGDVHFGDTKEGGILAARVASALDVPRGGRIENVYGGINEEETWGKAAHWCDYSGTVEGQQVGIALMDHPLSFRHPTHWHVRNYGLMTANPFGYAAYTNGAKEGSHTLAAGQTLSFRYRVLIHQGDAGTAQVKAHYLNFVAPPRVEITP